MLRQKFVDRLRKKYQYAGMKTTTPKSVEESIKPTPPQLTPGFVVPEESGGQKALSFAAKIAKYAPPLKTAGKSIFRKAASKALGPLSLMLGATKAYAPPIIDPKTGVNRYSGEQSYTPFQTGGMYNQMQQYKKGGESKKQRRNRIKNYTHPYLQQYYDEFATKGNISSKKDVRDILSQMNVTPSDTAFVNTGYGVSDVRSSNVFDVNQYIGSQMYDKSGTGNWSGNIGHEDKMPYYTSEPDEEGVSWDFMQNLYRNDADTYTGVLKSKKQTGGMYDQMRQYQGGGMVLPGGEMEQIPGSDAVQFNGADHDQGGIMLDPQTEVEDGETMDQVTMAKGGGQRKDYFFSSHLKKGGKSFADMHKDILRDGGNQQEIDWLAQMQENAAGRDPNQVAKLGGVMKYQNGSFLERDQVGPVATVIPEEDELDVYDEYGNLTADLVEGDYSQLAGNKPLTEEDKKQLKNEKNPSKIKEFFANLFKKKELTDEERYKRSLQRKTPAGAYIGGAAQLFPAAYAFLHKQPEAQQIDYTPGFTSPIIAERGKAAKLDRVNYNVERARNAGDMRAINKYIETSGGGPANVINKMMAYSKKQQGDAAISAAETKANIEIANREAQLAQQMELSNLQRSQQASTATAQLSQQEAARADEVEAINAAAKQKRIEDMEYMKYQGLTAAAQGIAGIVGDSLDYKAQERLAQVLGSEGIYEREKIVNFLMKEGMTAKEAKKKARELYNKYNPKEDENISV